MTTTPRSVLERISRPNPCFNRSDACGSMYSANGSPPRATIASHCAAVIGSVGTRNGSFAITSPRSAWPGTSTPSQNDAVPRRIACPDSRNRPSSASRLSSPCTSKGHRRSMPRERSSAASCFTSRWLVNSTNSPPSDALATSRTMRVIAVRCASASTFGAGTSDGMTSSDCAS